MSQRFKDVLYLIGTTLDSAKKEYAIMLHEKQLYDDSKSDNGIVHIPEKDVYVIAPTEDDIEKMKAYINQLMDAIDVLEGYDRE
jgi:hypothetical protein